jgi:hypothetical protein
MHSNRITVTKRVKRSVPIYSYGAKTSLPIIEDTFTRAQYTLNYIIPHLLPVACNMRFSAGSIFAMDAF